MLIFKRESEDAMEEFILAERAMSYSRPISRTVYINEEDKEPAAHIKALFFPYADGQEDVVPLPPAIIDEDEHSREIHNLLFVIEPPVAIARTAEQVMPHLVDDLRQYIADEFGYCVSDAFMDLASSDDEDDESPWAHMVPVCVSALYDGFVKTGHSEQEENGRVFRKTFESPINISKAPVIANNDLIGASRKSLYEVCESFAIEWYKQNQDDDNVPLMFNMNGAQLKFEDDDDIATFVEDNALGMLMAGHIQNVCESLAWWDNVDLLWWALKKAQYTQMNVLNIYMGLMERESIILPKRRMSHAGHLPENTPPKVVQQVVGEDIGNIMSELTQYASSWPINDMPMVLAAMRCVSEALKSSLPQEMQKYTEALQSACTIITQIQPPNPDGKGE